MKFTCLSKGRGFHLPPCHILNVCGFRILFDCPLDLTALAIFSPVPSGCHTRCLDSGTLDSEYVTRKRQKIEKPLDGDDLIYGVPWYKTVKSLHLWNASFIDVVLISSPMGMLGLPFLSRLKGFSAKIYVTEVTARLGQLMMEDLVSMHMEFRQFYGPEESTFPSWMNQEELDLRPSALREVVLGKDGADLGSWMPLYSAADVKDCLHKVQTLRYAEEACYNGTDDVKPVVYNFTYLLKVCADNTDLRRGKEIHGQLITNGYASNVFAMTGVVNLYAKCRQIDEAYKMFDRMPERDLVSWNTIIAGYAQNGLSQVAFDLVLRMQEEGQKPDSITLVTILPAAADMGCLRSGKSIHGYVIRSRFSSLVNISTALVDMYAKCASVGTARLIFHRMKQRTVVSWNSMIDGYVQSGESEEAMAIFQKMLDEGVEPTNVTIMQALHACADLGDLERGKFVHKLLDQLKLGSDVSVMNSLISMYSKCKRVDLAAKVFENLQGKTIVSWNAMILGYAQNGRVNEALNHFCEMQSQRIKPDSFSMVSVIPALAELSVTRQAKWMHGLVIRTCWDKNVFVMTALVDMYAKCGAIGTARKLFDMMEERHVTTWNSMIDGYGTHGLGKAAVELFNDMQKGTIKPNDVTFLCVISACSHSGLVKEGLSFFSSMKEDYGLKPSMDHYGAMVDLLGRAGKLNEAWDFIQKMPIEPGITVFGAMLGACKIHKNVELGEKAAQKLFELNPDEGGYHVLLSNIYATASMWDKLARVRTIMEKKGLQKTPGCSLVDLRNEVHSFYSGSTSHPQSKRIYAFLDKLGEEIKAAGYVPDMNSIHDVEDDVKQQLLNSHSEKLAIAFGLLNTSPGTTLHIRKNLRVCGDCHNATKYISLVTGREIIVRDMHRFHHFKNGTCSCGDYW